jgi:hypothetical protein
MDHCILWNNNAGGPQFETTCNPSNPNQCGPITATYSIIQGGFPGPGNIDADPLFVDPTPEGFDFRTQPGSPAIDAGNNAMFDIFYVNGFDLAGEPRRMDVLATPDTGVGSAPIIDIGPYEHVGSTDFACPPDIDGSGDVAIADLAALLAGYGVTSGATPYIGDLDTDGDVDLSDLTHLLSAFGTACP